MTRGFAPRPPGHVATRHVQASLRDACRTTAAVLTHLHNSPFNFPPSETVKTSEMVEGGGFEPPKA
jgi:hypothetical protein